MTADRRSAYLDARNALDEATRRAEQVVDVVTDACRKLQDWRNVRVSNIRIPMEVSDTAPSINGREWPTAQKLAESLAAWHHAHRAMLDALLAVPKPDRRGLPPPP